MRVIIFPMTTSTKTDVIVENSSVLVVNVGPLKFIGLCVSAVFTKPRLPLPLCDPLVDSFKRGIFSFPVFQDTFALGFFGEALFTPSPLSMLSLNPLTDFTSLLL